MGRYLALYMGSEDNDKTAPADPARDAEGMAAWGRWAEEHANAIVDGGAPLGRTLKVDAGGVSPARNLITGYVIVEAASHAEAAAIFKSHPQFAVFSKRNSVEVIECLEMPTV